MSARKAFVIGFVVCDCTRRRCHQQQRHHHHHAAQVNTCSSAATPTTASALATDNLLRATCKSVSWSCCSARTNARCVIPSVANSSNTFVGRPPSPAFHTYALLYLILFQAKTCLDEAFACGQNGQGGNCFVETIDGCCRWAAFGYRAAHCM